MNKIGLLTCIASIAAGLCLGAIRAAAGYDGFAMYVAFLLGVWLIRSNFRIRPHKRQAPILVHYAHRYHTSSVIRCLCPEDVRQDIRRAISAAASDARLGLVTPEEQLKFQRSNAKNARVWEDFLDRY